MTETSEATKKGGCAAAIATALSVLISIPASMIANGAVLVKLWGWFAVPVFHMEPLRIPEAIGLAMIASMVTHQIVKPAELDIPRWARPWALAILRPAIFLSAGWICSLFM